MYQEGGIALRTNPVTLPSLIKSVPPLGSSLGYPFDFPYTEVDLIPIVYTRTP